MAVETRLEGDSSREKTSLDRTGAFLAPSSDPLCGTAGPWLAGGHRSSHPGARAGRYLCRSAQVERRRRRQQRQSDLRIRSGRNGRRHRRPHDCPGRRRQTRAPSDDSGQFGGVGEKSAGISATPRSRPLRRIRKASGKSSRKERLSPWSRRSPTGLAPYGSRASTRTNSRLTRRRPNWRLPDGPNLATSRRDRRRVVVVARPGPRTGSRRRPGLEGPDGPVSTGLCSPSIPACIPAKSGRKRST